MKRKKQLFTLVIVLSICIVGLKVFAITTKGDINNDGTLTKDDALLLANKIWDNETDSCDKEVADYNDDGEITIKDAQAIMKEVNPSFLIGDANLDGKISQEDIDLVINYTLRIEKDLSDEAKLAADVNGDSIITTEDARAIVESTFGTKGDMNGDGKLSKEDALLLANKIWDKDTDSCNSYIADYNDDGEITIKDAQALMKDVDPSFLIGDANLDGRITKEDADLVIDYTLRIEKNLSDKAKLAADVNGDSIITTEDARAIIEITLGMKGDMNKDGIIDPIDASIALDKYKYSDATEEDLEIGDMDKNGIIDPIDASMILDVYKGV